LDLLHRWTSLPCIVVLWYQWWCQYLPKYGIHDILGNRICCCSGLYITSLHQVLPLACDDGSTKCPLDIHKPLKQNITRSKSHWDLQKIQLVFTSKESQKIPMVPKELHNCFSSLVCVNHPSKLVCKIFEY
jgi:hypothetical protein